MSRDGRAISIAILAMGGEGGGVLADWIVSLAEHAGYWAQNTSVAGVAQRTGATIYYAEIFPKQPGDREPILSMMPTPGEVDVVIASELMEAGRAVTRGLVTSDRTTFVASTSRVYSMFEKTSLGDGRVNPDEIIAACNQAAKTMVMADFSKIAEETGSVISAVLFGALAGTSALPFTREQFEESIRRGGVGVEPSLHAFDRAYEVATRSLRPAGVPISISTRPKSSEEIKAEADQIIAENPQAHVGEKLTSLAKKISETYPVDVRATLTHGIKRTAGYQDLKYAQEYLDRIAPIYELDKKFGNGSWLLTREVGRYCALWMTYEDTIRVAAIKVRQHRFDRISKEARARNEQVVGIMEFLHPQVQEVADTLPTALGRWVLRSKPIQKLILSIGGKGIRLNTTSIRGFSTLYLLSRLKPLRRRSLRFNLEQVEIDSWLRTIAETAEKNYALSCEVAQTQSLIKGYGETHENGLANFHLIMNALPQIMNSADPVARIKELRSAALAEENGAKLKAAL